MRMTTNSIDVSDTLRRLERFAMHQLEEDVACGYRGVRCYADERYPEPPTYVLNPDLSLEHALVDLVFQRRVRWAAYVEANRILLVPGPDIACEAVLVNGEWVRSWRPIAPLPATPAQK